MYGQWFLTRCPAPEDWGEWGLPSAHCLHGGGSLGSGHGAARPNLGPFSPSLGLGRPTPTLALTTNTQNTRHNIKTCSRLSRTRYHSLSFGKPRKNKFCKSHSNYIQLDNLIQCTYIQLEPGIVEVKSCFHFHSYSIQFLKFKLLARLNF